MDGRELPGFYFDPKAKKYFKIQKPHNASSPGSPYSLDNLRRAEQDAKSLQQQAMRSQKRQRETVVRQKARNPLIHASLDREIGFQRWSYYMQSLWPDAVSQVRNDPHPAVPKPDQQAIPFFVRDPQAKTIYAVHKTNEIMRRYINSPADSPQVSSDVQANEALIPRHAAQYSSEPWDLLARLTSPISSLTFLPASGALAATTIGAGRPPVLYLSDPYRDEPFVYQQFTPRHCSAIFGAAARPISFDSPATAITTAVAATVTENLVVAAERSLLLFERDPAGVWSPSKALESDADILAVDWLSPTTVALGCRNGKIRLYDTRSRDSSHVLTHPYPVSKLRRADDPTRLICSGLQDSLFLYDIRFSPFSRSSTFNRDNPHFANMGVENGYSGTYNNRKRRKVTNSWSEAVLTYQHRNPDILDLDIDVYPRLGLIAAAQDIGASTVGIRLHNMWTGKTVKEIGKKELRSQGGRVRCLKFMDDEEHGEISLWATGGIGGILRFDW